MWSGPVVHPVKKGRRIQVCLVKKRLKSDPEAYST